MLGRVASRLLCTRTTRIDSAFAGLTARRRDEPRLEHFILHEWERVGEAFPRQRWLRRLRRDLDLRWPGPKSTKPAVDDASLTIFVGHLGRERKLDTPELQPLRKAVLGRLKADGTLPAEGEPADTTRQRPDKPVKSEPALVTVRAHTCHNCGAIGHWKLDCPEPLRSGRGGTLLSDGESARLERRMQRLERLERDGHAVPRRARRARLDWHAEAEAEGGASAAPPAGGDDGPALRPLVYSREAGDVAEVDVRKVEALVRRRSEHRATRDFAAADAVRDELSALGVSVYDSEAKWFVGFGARFDPRKVGAPSPKARSE